MIATINLTKKYSTITAVKDINLNVRAGEIFGFLGPNGAGKTTTIRMLAGVLKPTSGSIYIAGVNMSTHPCEAKRMIGFIPDHPFLYGKLTGREFLSFVGQLYGVDKTHIEMRMDSLLDLFEMKNYAGELIEGYSHGMKQRLVMCAALLHQPRILIVDEPMVGLDPKAAQIVKDLFRDLSNNGMSVFMSTHTLEIAEEMCDRIGIIHDGSLIAVGTMAELRAATGGTAEKLETIFFKLTGEQSRDERSFYPH
ncbi:MAG: ABC transporter ATP-binding protein [Desulfobacterota bacterium]|nr:ABC transporter ATP-binding protein [Thermodesulfobacteriota bacterium]